MNAQSDFKQALLTTLALLVPVAIFIAAAPTETTNPINLHIGRPRRVNIWKHFLMIGQDYR